jgi:hypothetical protein
VYLLQVDIVLEDVQHGGHVLRDAGVQQGQDLLVAAQLRDLPHGEAVNVGRYFSAARGEHAGDI